MNQNQQQATMKQPPNVISSKDLKYLEDMLDWNLSLCKQARHYKMEVADQDIASEIDKVCQMHQNHYNRLLQLLQNNNNQ